MARLSRCWIALFALAATGPATDSPPAAGQDKSGPAVAIVNGVAVPSADLEFLYLSRKVPADQRDRVREAFVEQLIDAALMRDFLASRNARPNAEDLAARVQFIRGQITGAGDDPDRVLARLGYTEDRLRDTLALPLAWKAHARRMIGDAQIREHWEKHREELDGTRVRAAQIFRRAADEDQRKAAENELGIVRADIVAGRTTFADAARKHSESPTKAGGGDLGFIAFRGQLPPPVAKAAFALKPGEVSGPIHSPFGVHLVTVAERRPGDLSLEDVRSEVFERLQHDAWNELVRELRQKADIQRK